MLVGLLTHSIPGQMGSVASVVGSVAASINDTSNTRKLQLIAAGFAALGVFLILFTIWFWHSSQADHGALAPLEQMGTRRWRKAPLNEQLVKLAEARPAGALAIADAHRPASQDLAELVAGHEQFSSDHQNFSDLLDGSIESLTPEPEHESIDDASNGLPVLAEHDVGTQAPAEVDASASDEWSSEDLSPPADEVLSRSVDGALDHEVVDAEALDDEVVDDPEVVGSEALDPEVVDAPAVEGEAGDAEAVDVDATDHASDPIPDAVDPGALPESLEEDEFDPSSELALGPRPGLALTPTPVAEATEPLRRPRWARFRR